MDRGLMEHVREAGAHFERRLRALALQHPIIEEVRGAGHRLRVAAPEYGDDPAHGRSPV